MTDDDGLERYRVISRLGTGGMATVLLAEDLRLGRKVALKRLAGDDGPLRHGHERESNRMRLSRLRREALLGASVSHPNLVSIYDIVSTQGGGLVIVMEYVAGETLRDRMTREGRLSADEALPILQGIAGGLDAIHRRGIVHRDLKPANVLLGDDETVKLADFGIATGAESTRITSQGAVVGTFRYMAPEQLEDAPSSPAMDIYALAVVALEMLSGQKARPETHPIALAHALATQPPPDLRTTWPQAPAPVAELLMRAMARDPAERPRRAGELVGRLRAALADETTKHPLGSRPAKRTAARRAAGPVAPPPAAPISRGPTTNESPRRAVRDLAPPVPPGKARNDRPRRQAAGVGVSRRRLAAPVALLAVLAAGVAAVLIATSGSPRPSPASGGSSAGTRSTHVKKTTSSGNNTGSSANRTASSGRKSSSSGNKTASSGRKTSSRTGTSTAAASRTGTNAAAASGSGAGTGTAAASGGTTPPAAPTGSSAAAASTPAGAVESFYHLAASHQYSKAWSLADPNFQQQLGGYQSFEAGQADDRSITFNKATVTNQTTSSATVAVQTTSNRTSGTQSCTGNVNLVKSGASWQLDQIGINCS